MYRKFILDTAVDILLFGILFQMLKTAFDIEWLILFCLMLCYLINDFILSVLGAIFGAVPLVGTYWAALPGVLELCWSRGSPTLAMLLFVAQLLPMSCVDTAIYADIKGYTSFFCIVENNN